MIHFVCLLLSAAHPSFSSISNDPSKQYTRTPGGAPMVDLDRYTISASQNLKENNHQTY